MRKATDFEFRHQFLFHLLVVGLALLTYLVNPDDIVWAIVRGHSNNRMLERLVFGVGAIEVIVSAALETWVTTRQKARSYPHNTLRLARLLFALGLGLLLPWPGTVVLVGGETILVLRLLLRDEQTVTRLESEPSGHTTPEHSWRTGFGVSASKWGVAASLVLLSVTLQDRAAEIAAGIGFFAWLLMNAHRSFASGTR